MTKTPKKDKAAERAYDRTTDAGARTVCLYAPPEMTLEQFGFVFTVLQQHSCLEGRGKSPTDMESRITRNTCVFTTLPSMARPRAVVFRSIKRLFDGIAYIQSHREQQWGTGKEGVVKFYISINNSEYIEIY